MNHHLLDCNIIVREPNGTVFSWLHWGGRKRGESSEAKLRSLAGLTEWGVCSQKGRPPSCDSLTFLLSSEELMPILSILTLKFIFSNLNYITFQDPAVGKH